MQSAKRRLVCAPRSCRGGRLSTTIRSWRCCRCLALALAALLLRIPLLPPIGLVQPAFAGVDPCSPSADRILQDICVDGGPSPELMQFEQDTVSAWLTVHGMPPSNAELIYEHGRSDLRSVIRATMLARILSLIHKPFRTPNEAFVLQWFEERVKEKEVGLLQHAVDERHRWDDDRCSWKPDPQIAEIYGLHYTGGLFCSGGLGLLFSTTPQVPAKSYFLAAGFKESYGSGIGGSPVLRGTLEALLTATVYSVIPGAAGLGAVAFFATIFESAVGSVTFASFGLVVGGPALVVLFAVLVGVAAGFQLYDAQRALDELAELDAELFNARLSVVDLAALAATEEGMAKLVLTFVGATLPEFPSTSTLPAPGSDDVLFLLGSPPTAASPILSYRDWEGDLWTAWHYHGFFVQQGFEQVGTILLPVSSFSPMLHILDPHTGERLTASLVGSNFLVTRAEPDPDDEPCIANPFTGLSDASDLSTCSAYVVHTLDFRDGNGDAQTVRLGERPSFTSLATSTFTPEVAKTFAITAAGAPPTTIALTGSLPTGFTFVSTPDSGTASLVYDGDAMTEAGEHVVVLQAANGLGIATQNFTIRTALELAFTSSDGATFVGGKFGSFLVTTSGAPTPSIELIPPNCALGLSLTDNGDGTATFAGTPPTAPSLHSCLLRASNALGDMVDQQLFVTIVPPPPAQLVSADSTTFFSGVLNSFDFVTQGAETPVTISLPCTQGAGAPPSWVSLNDHGNGTATLFGNPPFGTDGAFSFRVHAFAAGGLSGVDCSTTNFTIQVSNVPTFLSRNRVEFGPPPITGGTFVVTTNQASGLISLEGQLPEDLSFTPIPGQGRAAIQGFPAVGTGGVYPLVLSMTNTAGTGVQHLRLQVKEAPTFRGAFDSVVFYVGVDNLFPVQTTGFPKSPELIGQANPVQLAMHIDVSGALPPGVSFTDTNQFDIPTGTGFFSGMPDAGSEGIYPLTLTADNGVLPTATLHFTLFVVKPGDVNRDGVVDERDLDVIRGALGTGFDDPDYDPLIDTNRDGIIDGQDLQFVKDACPDPDGDGACESATADRDADGIPDAEDFDPTGYLYDQSTGEILSGGRVIVTPAPAVMPFDGSGGFYQFFVGPGETVYTLTAEAPPGCRLVACPRLDPPPLDPMGVSLVLGSSEIGNTGQLGSAACSENPYALTLRLGETGDQVLLNNIPFDCAAVAAPAPALDARGILLALLALLGVAGLGIRRRRSRT